jgi:hypothetical protein
MLDILRHRFAQCGLELHPEKTKIIYCQDQRRKGHYSNTSFDFLGFTFRKRAVKGKTGELFMGFCPGISKDALKSIVRRIKGWNIGRRSDLSLSEIAKFMNPYLRGWWNYYGRYYRSLLYRLSRFVNQRLIRWATRKFKHLRGRKMKAVAAFTELAKVRPKLFAHWSRGISGAFV